MIVDDFRIHCLFCGLATAVVMSSVGIYVCEKCGHEKHDDRPAEPLSFTNSYTVSISTPTGTSMSYNS